MAVHGDFVDVLSLFEEESSRRGLRGVIGVASFDSVHDALLPVQQEVLKGLVGDDFRGETGTTETPGTPTPGSTRG